MKKEKVFTFNKQGEKLVGLKHLPQNKNKKTASKHKYPAIILVHGFGVNKEESGMFTNLAKVLAKNGFAVFYFDFSGRGESQGNYSKTSLTIIKKESAFMPSLLEQPLS